MTLKYQSVIKLAFIHRHNHRTSNKQRQQVEAVKILQSARLNKSCKYLLKTTVTHLAVLELHRLANPVIQMLQS